MGFIENVFNPLYKLLFKNINVKKQLNIEVYTNKNSKKTMNRE